VAVGGHFVGLNRRFILSLPNDTSEVHFCNTGSNVLMILDGRKPRKKYPEGLSKLAKSSVRTTGFIEL
jgi:hypothetical protein